MRGTDFRDAPKGVCVLSQRRDIQPNVHLQLPIGAEAPRLARWGLAPGLRFFDGETRFKIDLLLSELVANAVQHSDAWVTDVIDVRLSAQGMRTRVEVSDPGRAQDALVLPIARPELESRGFGLALLDRLADEWGVDRSDGTTIWFEVESPSLVERQAG